MDCATCYASEPLILPSEEAIIFNSNNTLYKLLYNGELVWKQGEWLEYEVALLGPPIKSAAKNWSIFINSKYYVYEVSIKLGEIIGFYMVPIGGMTGPLGIYENSMTTSEMILSSGMWGSSLAICTLDTILYQNSVSGLLDDIGTSIKPISTKGSSKSMTHFGVKHYGDLNLKDVLESKKFSFGIVSENNAFLNMHQTQFLLGVQLLNLTHLVNGHFSPIVKSFIIHEESDYVLVLDFTLSEILKVPLSQFYTNIDFDKSIDVKVELVGLKYNFPPVYEKNWHQFKYRDSIFLYNCIFDASSFSSPNNCQIESRNLSTLEKDRKDLIFLSIPIYEISANNFETFSLFHSICSASSSLMIVMFDIGIENTALSFYAYSIPPDNTTDWIRLSSSVLLIDTGIIFDSNVWKYYKNSVEKLRMLNFRLLGDEGGNFHFLLSEYGNNDTNNVEVTYVAVGVVDPRQNNSAEILYENKFTGHIDTRTHGFGVIGNTSFFHVSGEGTVGIKKGESVFPINLGSTENYKDLLLSTRVESLGGYVYVDLVKNGSGNYVHSGILKSNPGTPSIITVLRASLPIPVDVENIRYLHHNNINFNTTSMKLFVALMDCNSSQIYILSFDYFMHSFEIGMPLVGLSCEAQVMFGIALQENNIYMAIEPLVLLKVPQSFVTGIIGNEICHIPKRDLEGLDVILVDEILDFQVLMIIPSPYTSYVSINGAVLPFNAGCFVRSMLAPCLLQARDTGCEYLLEKIQRVFLFAVCRSRIDTDNELVSIVPFDVFNMVKQKSWFSAPRLVPEIVVKNTFKPLILCDKLGIDGEGHYDVWVGFKQENGYNILVYDVEMNDTSLPIVKQKIRYPITASLSSQVISKMSASAVRTNSTLAGTNGEDTVMVFVALKNSVFAFSYSNSCIPSFSEKNTTYDHVCFKDCADGTHIASGILGGVCTLCQTGYYEFNDSCLACENGTWCPPGTAQKRLFLESVDIFTSEEALNPNNQSLYTAVNIVVVALFIVFSLIILLGLSILCIFLSVVKLIRRSEGFNKPLIFTETLGWLLKKLDFLFAGNHMRFLQGYFVYNGETVLGGIFSSLFILFALVYICTSISAHILVNYDIRSQMKPVPSGNFYTKEMTVVLDFNGFYGSCSNSSDFSISTNGIIVEKGGNVSDYVTRVRDGDEPSSGRCTLTFEFGSVNLSSSSNLTVCFNNGQFASQILSSISYSPFQLGYIYKGSISLGVNAGDNEIFRGETSTSIIYTVNKNLIDNQVVFFDLLGKHESEGITLAFDSVSEGDKQGIDDYYSQKFSDTFRKQYGFQISLVLQSSTIGNIVSVTEFESLGFMISHVIASLSGFLGIFVFVLTILERILTSIYLDISPQLEEDPTNIELAITNSLLPSTVKRVLSNFKKHEVVKQIEIEDYDDNDDGWAELD